MTSDGATWRDRVDAVEQARDMAEAARDAHAAELRAIRDLVAPGNPQGTVVDAVRAWMDAKERATASSAYEALDRFSIISNERDAAIARAEKAERDRAALLDDIKTAVDRIHRTESDLRATNADLAKLRTERDNARETMAGLMAKREAADAELAKLRAELAELRARPVLTVERLRQVLYTILDDRAVDKAGDILAALCPAPLPSPDRAEELLAAYHGADEYQGMRWRDLPDAAKPPRLAAMRTALAKLSPAPAPAFDAAFLRRVQSATKHGPGGKGGPGPCDAACVKCEAERMFLGAPAREVAPTLVAVSDEELVAAYYGNNAMPLDEDERAGIRAVRAKLGAAEVTEERLAAALCEHFKYEGHRDWSADARAILAHLRATAAKGG